MKCPKCLYIGFETGDRCKNCGYDFSLLALAENEPPDLPLRTEEPGGPDLELPSAYGDEWTGPAIDRFRDLPGSEEPAMTLAGPVIVEDQPDDHVLPAPHLASASEGPALPLFAPDPVDDEPLVKLPVAPRPPLAVRRTPDTPRLRPVPHVERPIHEDAVLQFVAEPEDDVVVDDESAFEDVPPIVRTPYEPPHAPADRPAFAAESAVDASPFGRRVVAAIIDHGILLGIDVVVLYFTLRLTDLTFADWRLLPWLPLGAFLLALKVAYLSAFTTAGGQTIGKMATHIRVISEHGGRLNPGRSLRRALFELLSIATAGAPFLAAIADPERRGVHDRVSGSRVVAVSSSH